MCFINGKSGNFVSSYYVETADNLIKTYSSCVKAIIEIYFRNQGNKASSNENNILKQSEYSCA